MKFLKAVTTDGKTELFSLDKILTLTPEGKNVKILMGAGLFWRASAASLEIIEINTSDDVRREVRKQC